MEKKKKKETASLKYKEKAFQAKIDYEANINIEAEEDYETEEARKLWNELVESADFRFKRIMARLVYDAENTSIMFVGNFEECFMEFLRCRKGERTSGMKKN